MFGLGKNKSKVAEATFACEPDGKDLVVRLTTKGQTVPVADWPRLRPACANALAELEAIAAEERLTEDGRPLISFADGSVRLAPPLVAELGFAAAQALGLPPPTALALDLRSDGRIDEDSFRVSARWVRPGGAPVRAEMKGALLETADGRRRVPEPLWSLWRAAGALAEPLEKAARFKALAELRMAWPEQAGAPVESDLMLRDLRVHYASALSLKLRSLTPDHTDFDPVLFGAHDIAEADGEGRDLDEEHDSVLTPAAQKLFAEDRFRREQEARPVYVLRDGEYVFVDPALRPVLNQVRRLQAAPETERRAFILNPRKTLRDRLGNAAEAVDVDSLFVETEQFSTRVAGVDVWRAPVLPWLTLSTKNRWLPERFGVRIGETYAEVTPEDVGKLIERVETAEAEGRPVAEVGDLLKPAGGQSEPPPQAIPVTPQALEAVRALAPFKHSPTEESPPAGMEEAEAIWRGPGKLFLVVRENFEEVEFTAAELNGAGAPVEAPPVKPPQRLRTTLKSHQLEGLTWLARAASAGMPGVLLADDMGLGKTLQAVTFMAWLQDQAEAGQRAREPMLVVAPTGLLGTWREEIGKHLNEPQLGRLVLAFGAGLRELREEDRFSAKDIDTGRAALRAEAWQEAGVVLTTYETLRDYHFSFARTRFGLVVFDEIQKLKNPTSQMTRAAKTLNTAFTLGMTGTPVENRLQDLWSIMDVVAPGLLGASRDFERRHPADAPEALAALKARIMDGDERRPGWMLRRLKADALDGLPRKYLHPFRTDMPPAQANAYRDLVARASAASAAGLLGKGGMLQTLAALRGVSLHPTDPRQAPEDLDAYAAESARLSRALDLLKEIAGKGEKALIFLEDLAMQERLAALIQARFRLSRPPMRISGAVPGPKRQAMVTAFQTAPAGFDVMILSPKAGGVGLTITAANHVIHLSRWWNPAVEDQATDRVFRIGQKRDVHVHFPMAVHPDPNIRETSFDLRLDALIQRKRALTRDLFLPPEPGDQELADLFRDVAGGAEADASAEQSTSDVPVADEQTPAPAKDEPPAEAKPGRRVLSLPGGREEAVPRRWGAAAGAARPNAEVVALFQGRDIDRVVIRDPYALAHREARAAQVRFLSQLAAEARSLGVVELEYAPEAEGDLDDGAARRDLGDRYARAFTSNAPRLALTRRSKRSRDDDFHDRSVELYVRGAGGAIRTHELMIGRGLEALYNERFQCNVVYLPPAER